MQASGTAEDRLGGFDPLTDTRFFDVEVTTPTTPGWSIKRWTLSLLGTQGGQMTFTEDVSASARFPRVPVVASLPKAQITVQASSGVLGEYRAALTPSTSYRWFVTCEEKDITKATMDANAILGGLPNLGSAVSRYMNFVTR